MQQPSEWALHQAVWTAWPSDASLWLEDLEPARAEVAAMVLAIAANGQGERVELLAATEEAVASARKACAAANVRVHHIPFGDIWLRDTAPVFLNGTTAACFAFNGWGGKYNLDHDDTVGAAIGQAAGIRLNTYDWVLEGGALDTDGTGLFVTTEQCLLNPNRNPSLSRADIEARLRDQLGATRILWLGEGLANDHTDGHVDNLARFVGPNRLALPEASTSDEPNAAVFADAKRRAEAFGVEVVTIPSVGALHNEDGDIVPASYMNFYIGNKTVVVPTYGQPNDEAAVRAIAKLFPDRHVVGRSANAILTGGGSFHCITQQQPA